MSLGYLVPLGLGVALFVFAEEVVHARRFGPITDGGRSNETGGTAFRVLGVLLVLVGASEFLRMVVAG